MRECEVKLLAYLIGDGGLTGTNPRFTNADPRVRDEFAGAVAEFGGVTTTLEDSRGARTPYLNVRRDPAATRGRPRGACRRHRGGAAARARRRRARGRGAGREPRVREQLGARRDRPPRGGAPGALPRGIGGVEPFARAIAPDASSAIR